MLRWGRVEVTGGFLLLMAWLNYCDTQGLLPLALGAATAHELGHWVMIRGFGIPVTRLRLSAAGAELRLAGTLSYGRELACALAGPTVNLLLALWAAQVGAAVFAGLNLTLGLFNLLPMSALDGGRVLACLACWLFGPELAQRLSWAVDGALSVLLLVQGAVLLGVGGNVTLLVVAVWLICSFCRVGGKVGGKRGCQGTFERVK